MSIVFFNFLKVSFNALKVCFSYDIIKKIQEDLKPW
uniref:Uncharacterized protein n=1 Tax=Siphoviridae sp. ctnNB1 TaxID=2825660 RepID=A0A8S5UVC1_9CAUD|nr:MAG TPA: hypothetical protein [Siphoviridae sp. ctnNB1]